MWPDWAIFERSWQRIFFQKKPNICVTFGLFENLTFVTKICCGLFFGHILREIGLLYILTSGHTGWDYDGGSLFKHFASNLNRSHTSPVWPGWDIFLKIFAHIPLVGGRLVTKVVSVVPDPYFIENFITLLVAKKRMQIR